MKNISSILAALVILLSACNIPAANGTISDPAISTSAAQTVEAALNTGSLASPTAEGVSVNATPTFSEPSITVGDVTNCRSGPGVNFERITQISPGEQIKVIGVLSPDYWVVSTTAGICWVKAEFSTPAGNVQVVPTVTAPATPTGNAPEGVSLQKWDIFCNYQTNQADVTIKWSDEDNETGYRVVRNSGTVAELPENTTQYSETISLLSGQSVGYSVEAFNEIGSVSSKTIALYC